MSSGKKLINAYCDDVLGTRVGFELAALIAAGEIQNSEAIEAAIAHDWKVNPALNAIVTETFEHARSQREKPETGLLAGIPSFIKDTAVFYAAAEECYRISALPEIGLVEHPGKERLRIGMYTETPYNTPSHPD
jgi:hypothetical protein